jgi:hypothetical protein
MLPAVHAEMLRSALGELFSADALDAIIAANVRVDALWNQLGHDELHFDSNAFEQSYAFIAAQRARIAPALEAGRPWKAWQAFGRLTHTAQDFYSHSNYVDLWLANRPNGRTPSPVDIEPMEDALLRHPDLHSGKPYLPFGVLSFLPGLGRLVDPLLPKDSHARMHMDSAHRGPRFQYAFQAAVKRTRAEYDIVACSVPESMLSGFRGLLEPCAPGYV